MKRFLTTLAFLTVLFFAGACFGAGSLFQVTDDDVYYSPGNALNRVVSRMITLAFVADNGTGVIPSLVITEDAWTDGTLTGTLKHGSIEGWQLDKIDIDCNHGGTEPTEDSELYVYQLGVDLLDANGVNMIDNTVERSVHFATDGQPKRQDVVGAVTITVTQQAVVTNSAAGTLYLILVP